MLAPQEAAIELMEVLQFAVNKDPRASDKVMKLIEKVGIKSLQAKITFLTSFKRQVMLIPLGVFSEPNNRVALATAIQNALDQLIEQEEEGKDPTTF